MRMFLKLLLAFAPWLCFLFIAKGSMFRLELGLVVALVLSVVLGLARVHRGVILWVGLGFFAYAFVAVVLLRNMWTVHYMGVLANGALAAGTWLTLALGKPFTLDYAREHTDPALWNHPVFLRTNQVIAVVWGAVFTANAGIALYGTFHPEVPALYREVASYTLLLGALTFTTWYPAHLKAQGAAAETAGG